MSINHWFPLYEQATAVLLEIGYGAEMLHWIEFKISPFNLDWYEVHLLKEYIGHFIKILTYKL